MTEPKSTTAVECGALDGRAEGLRTGQVLVGEPTAPVCPLACGGNEGCTWRCPVTLHDALAGVLDSLAVAT